MNSLIDIQPQFIKSMIDLDNLILMKECVPQYIETNLDVQDMVMYDAIRLSMCSSWLLKEDVLHSFSRDFRLKLFKNIDAFPKFARIYFLIRIGGLANNIRDNELLSEYALVSSFPDKDHELQLYNPIGLLGNDIKDDDLLVLNGEMSLRSMIDKRIREFISTKDEEKIDFSASLFLPEILNPKFFNESSEAEQVVILRNMDKYFKFLNKFNVRSFGKVIKEICPPLCLLKHVLSCEYGYSERVVNLAWKQLLVEMESSSKNNTRKTSALFRIFSYYKLIDNMDKIDKSLHQSILKWLDDSEGVFESFELDCTLHNLNSTDFIWFMLTYKDCWKMLGSALSFQDTETRMKLYKELAETIVSVR